MTEPAAGINIQRAAGLLLLGAAAVMFLGASIPFMSALGGEAWTGSSSEVMEAVQRSPSAWAWANGLIAAAAILTTIGLALIASQFSNARAFAVGGLVAFAIGTTLDVVARIFNSSAGSVFADAGQSIPLEVVFEGSYAFSEALIRAFILLAFLGLTLFGLAIRIDSRLGVGRALVVVGLGGFVMEAIGVAIPALLYVATGALGVVLVTRSKTRTP